MITKVSTKDMTHEQWLERRKNSIGGSDAGAVLGLNKFKSAYALWAEKTGKIQADDLSDKEAVRLGNDLEEYVAQRWMEATGKKLRKDNNFYYNSEYPFAHANIDRAVVGEKAGFEAKTTSDWNIVKQCKEGKYPDTWYAQMVHYMMVTGLKKWYLGVLCLGRGFYCFEIERNDEEIQALSEAESEFWYCVTSDIPPSLDGTKSTADSLQKVLGDSYDGEEIDLSGVGMALLEYQSLTKQLKKLEEQANEAKAKIMTYMGHAEKGTFKNITVSYKTQLRNTFDKKSYEMDFGKIPDRYFKVTTSRPFKVNAK